MTVSLLGGTPPGLAAPRGRPAAVPIRAAVGALRTAERLSFQRRVLPYLRVLFDGVQEAQELGVLDASGVDHLSLAEDGAPEVAVQCKGFTVSPAEVGADQARQSVASVGRFRAAGLRADGFVLLHNRDHRNGQFTDPVSEALAGLVADGLVNWATVWSPQDLVEHVEEELVARVTSRALAESSDVVAGIAARATHVVEDVPFAESTVMVRRGTVNPASPVESASGDPVLRLQDGDDQITVLLGGFGFGKSTVAARTVSTWGRTALLLPAARISENGQNLATILRGLSEGLLDDLPAEDQDVLRGMVAKAVGRVLSSPNPDLALVVDALDEAPVVGTRNGLGAVLHSLRDLRVPVIVTMRTELWETRVAELSAALSDSERASKGRAVRVLELTSWTPHTMLDFVDRFAGDRDAVAAGHLRRFRDLVGSGRYEEFYGDIPCRPLFLRMLVDDVLVVGVRRRGRVELVDDWITSKLVRDHLAPLDVGGDGRVDLGTASGANLDEQLRAARTLMALAARTMIETGDDGTLVLRPWVSVDELRATAPAHLRGFDLSGLVTRSLLLPVGGVVPGRPVRVGFAHRAFQEFLLAESLRDDPDLDLEQRVPDPVRRWLDDMRG